MAKSSEAKYSGYHHHRHVGDHGDVEDIDEGGPIIILDCTFYLDVLVHGYVILSCKCCALSQ